MQEIRKMSRSRAADSVDNPETLEILPLKLGVGLNIAMHASPTARVFFFFLLISTFQAHAASFFENLSLVFCLVLVVANAGPCVGRRIKQATLLVVTDN